MSSSQNLCANPNSPPTAPAPQRQPINCWHLKTGDRVIIRQGIFPHLAMVVLNKGQTVDIARILPGGGQSVETMTFHTKTGTHILPSLDCWVEEYTEARLQLLVEYLRRDFTDSFPKIIVRNTVGNFSTVGEVVHQDGRLIWVSFVDYRGGSHEALPFDLVTLRYLHSRERISRPGLHPSPSDFETSLCVVPYDEHLADMARIKKFTATLHEGDRVKIKTAEGEVNLGEVFSIQGRAIVVIQANGAQWGFNAESLTCNMGGKDVATLLPYDGDETKTIDELKHDVVAACKELDMATNRLITPIVEAMVSNLVE